MLCQSRVGLGLSRGRTDGRSRSLLKLEGLCRAGDHRISRIVLSPGRARASRCRDRQCARRECHRRWGLDEQSADSRYHAGIPRGSALPDPQPLCHPAVAVRSGAVARISRARRAAGEDACRFGCGWNFGPAETDARPVSWLADELVRLWANGASWGRDAEVHPREAHFLKLDASKARSYLGWQPHLPLPQALEWIVEWYRAFQAGADVAPFSPGRRSNGMKRCCRTEPGAAMTRAGSTDARFFKCRTL